MTELTPEAIQKLVRKKVIWFASTRPDGRPHLAPVWFVYFEGKVYIGTDPDSVKVRNLAQNPHAVIALEDGTHPLIGEGTTRHIPPPLPGPILEAFQKKYEWDLTTEGQYHYVIEITPSKWMVW
jgi:hypothetical protein